MPDTFEHLPGERPSINNDMADRTGAHRKILDHERHQAQRAVAARCRSAEDARELLDALGILEP